MPLSNGKPGYRLSYSQIVVEKLKKLSGAAVNIGLGQDLAASLQQIIRRLETKPDEWGDPKFDYHAAGLKHYSGRHWMLIVEYAIHEDTHTVFIQSIRPLPGSPLADTAGEQ